MPAMVDGKIDLRKHFPAWICEVALLFRVESGKGWFSGSSGMAALEAGLGALQGWRLL